MSGECNVCGQEHAEIEHCPFKAEYEELQAENDRLRKAIKIAIPTIKEAMAEYYKARYIDLRVLVEALKGE